MSGSALERQIALIRAQVVADGGAFLNEDELRILCPDELTLSEQFARIARIAQRER